MDRECLRARLTADAPFRPEDLYALGLDALDHDLEVEVAARVRHALVRFPDDPRLWQVLGLALRADLDAEQAHEAFRRAATLAPNDALIAHSSARTAIEAGLPASRLYARARTLAPGNGDVLLGECVALRAEGTCDTALRRLADILAANPGWYDGHAGFARLAATSGWDGPLTETVDAALKRFPYDPGLWRSRYRILSGLRDHQAAYDTAMRAASSCGQHESWIRLAAGCQSEMGNATAAWALFTSLPEGRQAMDLVHPIRTLIRLSRYDEAAALADRGFDEEQEHILWPYRALLWRLMGDPRWAWLEGDERLVAAYDLRGDIGDLAELTDALRLIHTRSGTMLDQSVRGGTQTDGHLLARREPCIRRLRLALTRAVETHVARLPNAIPGHPTLGGCRMPLRFVGSWSVRLNRSGFHSDHVHPQGWLSSAFYVTIPGEMIADDPCSAEGSNRPPDRAGWLAFGECRELLPDLEGFRFIEPQPGHLVLFPSTMWHGTRPFAAGERMTVAFDIARPRSDA